MKTIVAILIMALALTGCQTITDIDAAVAKTAPAACAGVTTAYTAFVATGLGSDKDKAAVDAAYAATTGICADPSRATSVHLVVLAAQLATIVKTMRKVKTNA